MYMLASALYRMSRPPLIVGGVAMLWGYFKSWITRQPRYEDPEFRRFLRGYQRACLMNGKSRATEALNRQQANKWTQQSATRHPITSGPAAA